MISVVILSYNTKETTLKCLECLYRSKGADFEVIVIDNASSDGSAEAIAGAYPKVKLSKNKVNNGFAAGSNQGMSMASGEWILLLNSDAFVFEDSLQKMLRWVQTTPQADVIGPQILNRDGTLQQSWGFFPTLARVASMMTMIDNIPGIRDSIPSIHVRAESRYVNPTAVDWITGACVLLKAEVWKKAGGIDEHYFMYGEEMEWMYRIRKTGFQTWYTSEARVIHIGRASSGDQGPALIGEMKGWLYWWTKHNPEWEAKILPLVIIAGCLLRIVVKPSLADIYKKAISEIWGQTFGQSKK